MDNGQFMDNVEPFWPYIKIDECACWEAEQFGLGRYRIDEEI